MGDSRILPQSPMTHLTGWSAPQGFATPGLRPPLTRQTHPPQIQKRLFFFDIRYFAHTALGPWIAGVTFFIYFWAWGLWRLVFVFMIGLFYFVRFYLIFLR
jgi:hypothetical protein